MSRKLVSVVFAAAAFVAAFASSAMVSSASAQGRGYYPHPAGPVVPVPHAVPVPVVPGVVAPAFHGGPHYGPPRGHGYYAPPPPRRYGYGHHRRWDHRRGPPPWAYGPPRPRYYHW